MIPFDFIRWSLFSDTFIMHLSSAIDYTRRHPESVLNGEPLTLGNYSLHWSSDSSFILNPLDSVTCALFLFLCRDKKLRIGLIYTCGGILFSIPSDYINVPLYDVYSNMI